MKVGYVLLLLTMLGCTRFSERLNRPKDDRNYDPRLDGIWQDAKHEHTFTFSNGLGTNVITGASNILLILELRQIKGSLLTNLLDIKSPVVSGNSVDGISAITNTFRYQVLQRGGDYVVIGYPDHPFRNVVVHPEPTTTTNDFMTTLRGVGIVSSDTKIHFTPDGRSCWVGENYAEQAWYYRLVTVNEAPTNGTRP